MIQALPKSVRLALLPITTSLLILSGQSVVNSQDTTRCRFVPTSEVSSIDQAKCLLRKVNRFGHLDPTRSSLPSPLDRLLSQPTIDLDKAKLRQYLQRNQIQESAIGGSLDQPVSRANNNASNGEPARYFVIHDTSTPNFRNGNFPDTINSASWSGNNLTRWTRGEPIAHVFINRVGNSVTPVNFNTPWRATQYEVKKCGIPCKGLFLNIEMVQPRRSCPSNSGNDACAPEPGFTDEQLDRLALVYIAASVRRGKWLIPAFHASIDTGWGFNNVHDDPQNFDLDRWASRLDRLLTEINSGQ